MGSKVLERVGTRGNVVLPRIGTSVHDIDHTVHLKNTSKKKRIGPNVPPIASRLTNVKERKHTLVVSEGISLDDLTVSGLTKQSSYEESRPCGTAERQERRFSVDNEVEEEDSNVMLTIKSLGRQNEVVCTEPMREAIGERDDDVIDAGLVQWDDFGDKERLEQNLNTLFTCKKVILKLQVAKLDYIPGIIAVPYFHCMRCWEAWTRTQQIEEDCNEESNPVRGIPMALDESASIFLNNNSNISYIQVRGRKPSYNIAVDYGRRQTLKAAFNDSSNYSLGETPSKNSGAGTPAPPGTGYRKYGGMDIGDALTSGSEDGLSGKRSTLFDADSELSGINNSETNTSGRRSRKRSESDGKNSVSGGGLSLQINTSNGRISRDSLLGDEKASRVSDKKKKASKDNTKDGSRNLSSNEKGLSSDNVEREEKNRKTENNKHDRKSPKQPKTNKHLSKLSNNSLSSNKDLGNTSSRNLDIIDEDKEMRSQKKLENTNKSANYPVLNGVTETPVDETKLISNGVTRGGGGSNTPYELTPGMTNNNKNNLSPVATLSNSSSITKGSKSKNGILSNSSEGTSQNNLSEGAKSAKQRNKKEREGNRRRSSAIVSGTQAPPVSRGQARGFDPAESMSVNYNPMKYNFNEGNTDALDNFSTGVNNPKTPGSRRTSRGGTRPFTRGCSPNDSFNKRGSDLLPPIDHTKLNANSTIDSSNSSSVIINRNKSGYRNYSASRRQSQQLTALGSTDNFKDRRESEAFRRNQQPPNHFTHTPKKSNMFGKLSPQLKLDRSRDNEAFIAAMRERFTPSPIHTAIDMAELMCLNLMNFTSSFTYSFYELPEQYRKQKLDHSKPAKAGKKKK